MYTQTDIIKFLADHKTDFQNRYNIIKIGLFGSYARNEQSEASDIDILVEFAPGTNDLFEKKSQLRATIQGVFNREVDICREKYIKPIFRKQILGQAIYV